MWNSARNLISLCQVTKSSCKIVHEQIRTTYILKRKYEPRLHKKNLPPKPLKTKNYIYEIVKNTSVEPHEPLKLILIANIEGLGNKGDLVEVKPNYGYNELILLKKAVYASEENVKKYANLQNDKDDQPSSPYVPIIMKSLEKMTLSVVMNKENPWTLQPWHIKTSFRKCGWEIPEKAIILPETPITGPNMDIENKDFTITVVFSPKETQEVRCRIHHWSTDPSDRLPYVKEFWKIPTESIFQTENKSNT